MSIVILAHGLWGPYEQDRISIVCLTYAYHRYEILDHSVMLCCKTTETRDRAQKRKEERICWIYNVIDWSAPAHVPAVI